MGNDDGLLDFDGRDSLDRDQRACLHHEHCVVCGVCEGDGLSEDGRCESCYDGPSEVVYP